MRRRVASITLLLGIAFSGLALPGHAQAPGLPAPPAAPATTLASNQAAVVLIKGDTAEGTGFLIKTADGPTVVTNIHVLSNNPNVKITTDTGVPVTIGALKGATDRDLAMIAIKDGAFSYLTLATDVSGTVHPGDEVITPGNSEGGGVMLNTSGKVLGIGPDRIEFNNPIYHGNSGGPVFHTKSGQVVGVVTDAVAVDTSDALDKASFASRDSAIHSSMRYFGLRLDTVPGWEAYDWKRLQIETAFLDQFDQRSRCLDSYLNAAPTATPDKPKKKKRKKKPAENPAADTTAALLWRTDAKLLAANDHFFDQSAGADTSQQMDALRGLMSDLNDLADADMAAIQNPGNFYSFDQIRARDEIAYRKALKDELGTVGNNVSRLTSLPRTND